MPHHRTSRKAPVHPTKLVQGLRNWGPSDQAGLIGPVKKKIDGVNAKLNVEFVPVTFLVVSSSFDALKRFVVVGRLFSEMYILIEAIIELA